MENRKLITRRQALVTGLASAGALLLPGCSKELPPTYGHLLRMGDNLTYRAQRLLLSPTARVREYSHLVVTDEFVDPGRNGPIQNGWSWYAGI
jgi:hypothetical protein